MPVPIPSAPIVCGVDFSPESRRALLYASALAQRLGCRLHLVSAVEPLLSEAARLRHQFEAFIENVARELREFARPLPLAAERVSHEAVAGEPAAALLAVAAANAARLIVVGTRGRGQAARLFLGSTTLRLLRTTNVPVLVTDWDAAAEMPDAAARGTVSRLICGVDFSNGSGAAVDAAAGLAKALDAGLALVHAVGHASVPVGWSGLAGDVEAGWVADATAKLDALARSLGVPCTSLVRVGSPAEVLAEEAASDPLAILAVGVRGAAHHRPGSTALHVVALTKTPVLAVPQ
jgi:nucleotide-binding universal stress UspA family protein